MHGTPSALLLGEALSGPTLVAAAALGVVALVTAYLALRRQRSQQSAPSRRTTARGGLNLTPDAVEAWSDQSSPRVLVVNRSERPIHDVQAYVALGRRRANCVGWIRTLPPTGEEAARVAITAESREHWIRWQRDERSKSKTVAVELTFRDDSGRRWRRDRTGSLAALD